MVRNVILHIGMHKTGTTSLQNSLQDYDDGDIFYAPLGDPNHSEALFTAFSSDPSDYHIWRDRGYSPAQIEEQRTLYLSKLNTALLRANRSTVVFSGEDAGVLDAEGKKQLIDYLQSNGRSVRVICYVRDPRSFAASFFQQALKGGLAEVPKINPNYRLRLETLKHLLPESQLTVRRFDRESLIGGNIISDFAALTGLQTELLVDLKDNSSLPFSAMKMLFIFNRGAMLSSGDDTLYRARIMFIGALRTAFADQSGPPLSLFDDCAIYAGCAYLAKHFGIAFEDEAASRGESGDVESAEQKLLDIEDWEVEVLNQALGELGLTGDFPTVGDKLNRLFLHYVYRSHESLAPRETADTGLDEEPDTSALSGE